MSSYHFEVLFKHLKAVYAESTQSSKSNNVLNIGSHFHLDKERKEVIELFQRGCLENETSLAELHLQFRLGVFHLHKLKRDTVLMRINADCKYPGCNTRYVITIAFDEDCKNPFAAE